MDEGTLSRDLNIGGLEGNRLVAVDFGYLHAAIPHPVLHVAAPEDDEARLEFLFSVTNAIFPHRFV